MKRRMGTLWRHAGRHVAQWGAPQGQRISLTATGAESSTLARSNRLNNRGTEMNLSELQRDLRHFAAEREWQPFHTPKNLSMALMVEAAELAEIFQWMTPEESASAHSDPPTKERICEEVADVLLYLLQLADRSQIDIERAVRDKLAKNAQKYPAKRAVPELSPTEPTPPCTHILLDFENVQPTESDLRKVVPDARHLWVFHGPHQRQVEKRFKSFKGNVTTVPISRTGKNALDFHLSFYMGYLAARHQTSPIVVFANDTGYDPMLEHARTMAFAVRRQGHGQARAAPTKPAAKPAKVSAKKIPPAKKASSAKPKMKAVAVAGARSGAIARITPPTSPPSIRLSSITTESPNKIIDNLRSMGDKRPARAAALRRALKSFLGVEAGDPAIEFAVVQLVARGVIAIDTNRGVEYPGFAS